MRIQELERQISQLRAERDEQQNGVDALVTGLAHVVDTIVPELARPDVSPQRRRELAEAVQRIREALTGAPPVAEPLPSEPLPTRPEPVTPRPEPEPEPEPEPAPIPEQPRVRFGTRGINLDWLNAGASPLPSELAGFNWVRLIAHPNTAVHPIRPEETLAGYIEDLRAHDVRTVLVLPAHAFSGMGAVVPEAIAYAEALNPDVWQIGNEPDASWHPANNAFENTADQRQLRSIPSWCLEPEDYLNLVFNLAPAIRSVRPDAHIISAGFASGFPEWMDQPSWDALVQTLDGIAVHPYLKRPQEDWPPNGLISGEERAFVGELLDEYRAVIGDAPLWITEFGTTDSGLHTQYYARMYCTLDRREDVRAACAFCYSEDMNNEGYALLGTGALTPFLSSPPLPFS